MTPEQKEAVKNKLYQEYFGGSVNAINSIGDEQYLDVNNGNVKFLIRVIVCKITDDFDDVIVANKREVLAYANAKGYKTAAICAVKFADNIIVADKFHTY